MQPQRLALQQDEMMAMMMITEIAMIEQFLNDVKEE